MGAVDRARAGSGGLVLLSGDAGVGKTRLTAEVADARQRRAAAQRRGEPQRHVPYGPVVAALRWHLRSEPGALAECGPLGAHLAMILPELGDAGAGERPPDPVRGDPLRASRLAAERLVLMVLDDLHWSDEATLELLSALADPLDELSVLVVAAYRSDGLAARPWPAAPAPRAAARRRLDELVLGPLEPDNVARCLRRRSAPAVARRSPRRCTTRPRARRSSSRSWRAPAASAAR